MALSPFVASFHLPGRQYQRRFGLRPQLWPVSPYQLHDWNAPFANPDSQQHEPNRMGSYQMTHYNQNKNGRQRSIQSARTDERVVWHAYCLRDPDNSRRDVETRYCEETKWPSKEANTLVSRQTI